MAHYIMGVTDKNHLFNYSLAGIAVAVNIIINNHRKPPQTKIVIVNQQPSKDRGGNGKARIFIFTDKKAFSRRIIGEVFVASLWTGLGIFNLLIGMHPFVAGLYFLNTGIVVWIIYREWAKYKHSNNGLQGVTKHQVNLKEKDKDNNQDPDQKSSSSPVENRLAKNASGILDEFFWQLVPGVIVVSNQIIDVMLDNKRGGHTALVITEISAKTYKKGEFNYLVDRIKNYFPQLQSFSNRKIGNRIFVLNNIIISRSLLSSPQELLQYLSHEYSHIIIAQNPQAGKLLNDAFEVLKSYKDLSDFIFKLFAGSNQSEIWAYWAYSTFAPEPSALWEHIKRAIILYVTDPTVRKALEWIDNSLSPQAKQKAQELYKQIEVHLSIIPASKIITSSSPATATQMQNWLSARAINDDWEGTAIYNQPINKFAKEHYLFWKELPQQDEAASEFYYSAIRSAKKRGRLN
ncbi:MAG: hypothetical protein Q8M92_00235, partial [Candidatus Subteraquimicrobiales bacterium]|nr:hypothetical protein [Candidatus Subteraquimicrobiales bacterium]